MADNRRTTGAPADLAADMEAQAAVLQRELGEVDLLLGQVRTEAQRHETRRQQTSERFDAQLGNARASGDLREAHEQLMLQSRRAALMEAQLEVLEGKQKVLRRFADYLGRAIESLSTLSIAMADSAGTDGAGGIEASARSVLEAQEEMRRQIARQMHDGPAQSIANIALQAEVVQRLLRKDPAASERELGALREMVEHALDETKAFIFDVRPMVLDDLGLMPTLRRAAQDWARRTGRRIRFESLGADRRLDADQESALFRIVDDAVTGYLEGQPDEVTIRLSWSDEDVTATIASEALHGTQSADTKAAKGAAAAALPPALAAMIDEQRGREHSPSGQALAPAVMDGIKARAAAARIEISTADDGRTLNAVSRSVGARAGVGGSRAQSGAP